MSEVITKKHEEKGQLRKLALSRRNSLSLTGRETAGAEIAAKVLSLPEIEDAQIIMCYRSFRSEVPTGEIIAALLARGKTLCYPLCGKLGRMWAYSPHDDRAWKPGMMGIMEPDVENSRLVHPEEIDIVICPMVGFDENKQRMGYGGGYYDRYLPKCKKALRIGLAFEAQKIENLVTDDYDLPMDIVITEEKIYR